MIELAVHIDSGSSFGSTVQFLPSPLGMVASFHAGERLLEVSDLRSTWKRTRGDVEPGYAFIVEKKDI